jgi:hypothetical protein
MEAIIESLNNHIKEKRAEASSPDNGYLVLQKIIKTNEKFPIYKEYEYIIWNVHSKTKDKIFDVKHTEKIADGKDENMIRYLRVKLIESVLNWMHSDSYNKVVYGK